MNSNDILFAIRILLNGDKAKQRRIAADVAESFRVRNLRWTDTTGIVGFGIGPRTRLGEPVGDTVLKVYVVKKLARSEIGEAVPRSIQVPGLTKRIPTDVDEIGEPQPFSYSGRVRPATGGVLISCAAEKGTLGVLVRRRTVHNDVHLLSARHVIAPLGVAEKYLPVQQPVIAQSGRVAANQIASLNLWGKFQPRFLNRFDAAIARCMDGRVSPRIRRLGLPKGVRTHLRIGTKVSFCGAKSDLQHGTVSDRHLFVRVGYRSAAGFTDYGFQEQILCALHSESGDSGALLLDENNLAVGLVIGGTGAYAVITPIRPVLDEWGLELVTAPLSEGEPLLRHTRPAINDYDRAQDILARTIWGEAEGESERGKKAVAAVVVNRTKRPQRFSMDVESVCLQRKQFSCWNSGTNRRRAVDAVDETNAVFRRCLNIADSALQGRLADPTNGADHYHARSVLPSWAENHQPCAVIGAHIFYNDIN